MKCFVTFRLKRGVTRQEYEEWFRRENVPAVRKMSTIKSYRAWHVVGEMEGSPPDFVEEMEIDDRGAFEAGGVPRGEPSLAALEAPVTD